MTSDTQNVHQTLKGFLADYGPDFFKKLPHYQTAYLGKDCVKLIKYHEDSTDFLIEKIGGERTFCDLFSLNDFCL